MKSINVISLVQAYKTLTVQEYEEYIKYYGIEIKSREVDDLENLVINMYEELTYINIYNCFYVGYKIKHISKEFDLLRFGKNYILNIELKNTSTEDKIKKQLIQNKSYLKHINYVVHNFSYVVQTNKLYKLNNKDELEIVDFGLLTQLLTNQELLKVNSPDELFNPSDYLVSPFNSTEKFISNQYFLTGQQEIFKNKLITMLNNKPFFASIKGGPGTGKTLLTYDIVKSIKDEKNSLIVHCGQLNEGHIKLIQSGWDIIPIKSLSSRELTGLNLVVIDEAQRIVKSQFDKLIKDAAYKNISCLFSYDKQQTLSRWESIANIGCEINSIQNVVNFELSEKIRTNKEISSFIKLLFNNKRNDIKFSDCGNVDFDYFTNIENAKNYIQLISNDNWEVLKPTPSQYNNEYNELYANPHSKNAHLVIGQEFDNVAVVIDKFFSYNTRGNLTYNSSTYYDSVKMLFQNITRTRKKLKLIIIDNKFVLGRCLSILKSND